MRKVSLFAVVAVIALSGAGVSTQAAPPARELIVITPGVIFVGGAAGFGCRV